VSERNEGYKLMASLYLLNITLCDLPCRPERRDNKQHTRDKKSLEKQIAGALTVLVGRAAPR
jgi:hypothetical protein